MEILQGIAAFAAGSVEYMDQNLRAFYMAEEFIAKACALGSAFDEARDVGHDEASFIVQIYHPKDRIQRGEMVRSHFRLRSRNLADEARFPYAGETQKAHIGQDFQL